LQLKDDVRQGAPREVITYIRPMLRFLSDRDKAAANFRKHGVTCDEAATAFGDLLSITISDPEHSLGEEPGGSEHGWTASSSWAYGTR